MPPRDEAVPRIHVVVPFKGRGGSEERALGLVRLLRDHAVVQLWSPSAIHPHYAGTAIRRLRAYLGRFPRGGTVVFVGTWQHLGAWIHLSGAKRLIVVQNASTVDTLHRKLRQLRSPLLPAPELVYCSPLIAAAAGLPGTVEISPIDLDRFRPVPHPPGRPFTVGRLSRDTPAKFGPNDPQLFRALAADGMRVRLLGARCLAPALDTAPGVELLPFGAEDPAAFLAGLDCFLYRTADGWPEPHGRVVSEAMACGVPVVCHRSGGYADSLVHHGRTGFLYETDEEAAATVRALRDDAGLRARIGAEGRRHVEQLLGPEAARRTRAFYLGAGPPETPPAV